MLEVRDPLALGPGEVGVGRSGVNGVRMFGVNGVSGVGANGVIGVDEFGLLSLRKYGSEVVERSGVDSDGESEIPILIKCHCKQCSSTHLISGRVGVLCNARDQLFVDPCQSQCSEHF